MAENHGDLGVLDEQLRARRKETWLSWEIAPNASCLFMCETASSDCIMGFTTSSARAR